MEADNASVVRALFDAFNEGSLDRTRDMVTEDFELFDVAAGQTLHGPDGCRQWLATFRTALPDARTELINMLVDGDRVATEHVGRGTHRGPFVTPAGTIPPTGRPMELRIAEMYRVRAGKIGYLRAYYDSTTIMRQLGLLPRQGSSADRLVTQAMGLGVKVQRVFKKS
jgi:steroid delta-isomerase-like uncharacterized protein